MESQTDKRKRGRRGEKIDSNRCERNWEITKEGRLFNVSKRHTKNQREGKKIMYKIIDQ